MEKFIYHLIILYQLINGCFSSEFGFLSEKIYLQEGSTTVIRFGLKGDKTVPKNIHELHCSINCTDYGTASKPGSLDADFTMSVANTNNFILNEENEYRFTFFVKILEDSEMINDNNETIIWYGSCFTDKERKRPVKISPEKIIIEIKDTTDEIDPHFTQIVFGQDEDNSEISEKICFNIYGRKGDVFNMLNDTLLDCTVLSHFKDTFHIDQVKVQTPVGNVLITLDTISLEGQFRRTWLDKESTFIDSNPKAKLLIDLSDKILIIRIENESRLMALKINRVMNKYSGDERYLDIYFREVDLNGKRMFDEFNGGLIGHISNRNYQFHQPVQENVNIASVIIDNRPLIVRKKKTSKTKTCYSIDIFDLLGSYSLKQFIKY